MELEFQNATIGLLKFFFFKLDYEKIKFQKIGIFLISLGNKAKCCFFCPKRAFANFVPQKTLRELYQFIFLCNLSKEKMSPYSFSLSHTLTVYLSQFWTAPLKLSSPLYVFLFNLLELNSLKLSLFASASHKAEWPQFSFFSSFSVSTCPTRLRGCLIRCFEQQFSVFKQHYTYFHTLFHPHVFLKKLKTVV